MLKGEYKTVAGIESRGGVGSFGLQVNLLADLTLTEDESWALQKLSDQMSEIVQEALWKRDPKRAEWAKRNREELLSLFANPLFVEEIPNEYGGPDGWYWKHLVWMKITTPKGRIKVGPRKRVLVIDWSESVIAGLAEEIFPDVDETKHGRMIHSHDTEKARQMIARLLEQPSAIPVGTEVRVIKPTGWSENIKPGTVGIVHEYAPENNQYRLKIADYPGTLGGVRADAIEEVTA